MGRIGAETEEEASYHDGAASQEDGNGAMEQGPSTSARRGGRGRSAGHTGDRLDTGLTYTYTHTAGRTTLPAFSCPDVMRRVTTAASDETMTRRWRWR